MDIKEALKHEYSRRTKQFAKERRNFNIESFSKLDRSGLEYGKIERRLFLHSTSKGEKLYIQYPGKESVSIKKDVCRPWDFRPKLEYYCNYPETKTTVFLNDLPFKSIFGAIDKIKCDKMEKLQNFAAVYFRLAYMLEHEKVSGKYKYEDIDVETGTVINTGYVHLEWYKPYINPHILDELNSMSDAVWTPSGITPEIYLMYFDLLAQNEDAKYFYGDTIIKNSSWNSSHGRENTIKSCLNMIAYRSEIISLETLLDRFTKGRGIAAMSLKEIQLVTGGLIATEKNLNIPS